MSASVDTALCSWCLSTRREDLQLLQPTLQHGPGWVLCSWAQQTPSLAALGSRQRRGAGPGVAAMVYSAAVLRRALCRAAQPHPSSSSAFLHVQALQPSLTLHTAEAQEAGQDLSWLPSHLPSSGPTADTFLIRLGGCQQQCSHACLGLNCRDSSCPRAQRVCVGGHPGGHPRCPQRQGPSYPQPREAVLPSTASPSFSPSLLPALTHLGARCHRQCSQGCSRRWGSEVQAHLRVPLQQSGVLLTCTELGGMGSRAASQEHGAGSTVLPAPRPGQKTSNWIPVLLLTPQVVISKPLKRRSLISEANVLAGIGRRLTTRLAGAKDAADTAVLAQP